MASEMPYGIVANADSQGNEPRVVVAACLQLAVALAHPEARLGNGNALEIADAMLSAIARHVAEAGDDA